MSASSVKPNWADVAYAYGLAVWLWLSTLRRTLQRLEKGT